MKKANKLISIFLALAMILSMVPITAHAASDYSVETKLKFRIINLVREHKGVTDELDTYGSDFDEQSLIKLARSKFQYTFKAALSAGGGTWWSDPHTVTFDGVDCTKEYYKTFDFTDSTSVGGSTMTWTYTVEITRSIGHIYSSWSDNHNGTHSRVCSICDYVDKASHDWVDATCVKEKYCRSCGVVEGKALGHNFADATCTSPEKCTLCGATQGEKNSENHTSVSFAYEQNSNTEHYKYLACCKKLIGTETHIYNNNGNCKDCGYACGHASYTNGYCDVCGYRCPHMNIADGVCQDCGVKGTYPYFYREWNSTTNSLDERILLAPADIAEITSSTTSLTESWYIVKGTVTLDSRLDTSGNVNLILADNSVLNANNGIFINSGSLSIYAQSDDLSHMGKINAKGSTAIRCMPGQSLTIHGGNISATASGNGAGIGGEPVYETRGTISGTITINGGHIYAYARNGAGIGSGYNESNAAKVSAASGTITINGGTINAKSAANQGAGIGGGRKSLCGPFIFNGGNIKAYGYVEIGHGAHVSNTISINNSEGDSLSKFTYTLAGLTRQAKVTEVEGISYGLGDVYTHDTNKLYLYLPSYATVSSVTANGTKYHCAEDNNTLYSSHNWDSGICTRCGATVTLGDSLTYNGTTQTQTVKSVKVNGITMTEGVDYTVSGNTGVNAGTYTLKITGKNNTIGEITKEWEIARLPVIVTAENLSKTYGDADPALGFTVNKEEFKSDLVGELARTHDENVGAYAITQGTLANENNPNYDITFVSGLFTIEPDTSGIENITVNNVKSSDKESVEYVYNQLKNAVTDLTDDETKAEYKAIADKCDELLAVINDTAEEIAIIENAVNSYDEESVKSTDKADLEKLIEDIKAVTDKTNITDDERAKLAELDEKIDALIKKIDDTKAKIDRINEAVNAYDEETVKSSDKVDIEQLIADIKELTDAQTITAEEREYLVNADAECDKLLAKIAETKTEYDRVIAAANGYDETTVTSADKDALVQLNEDIYALALTDNVTEDEKAALQTAHDKVIGLADKIAGISDEIKRIIDAVDKYVFESVKSDDKADIQQLIADIKNLLETQNITTDERTILETSDETCDKLIAKIDETVAEINRINEATNAYDEATVTSADKANIEKLIADIKALTDGDNITDAEREQLNGNDEPLGVLLEKVNAVADEIARIEETANAYDEKTVKSTDKADLEQLKADIKALTDTTNISEDERAKFAELDAKIDALIKKIDDTKAEIDRINEAVKGYDEETVKSSDIPALDKLIEDIKALTDGDNLTDDEKAVLEAYDAAVDALVERIAETEEKIEEIKGIKNSLTPENVSSDDKSVIEEKIAEIEAINPDNLTDEQKAEFDEIKADFEALLEEIEAANKTVADIGTELEMFDEERITIFWEDEIEALKAKIDELFADENMGEAEKAKLSEYRAQAENLIEVINAPLEYFSLRFFYLIWDCILWKYNGILSFFSKIFGC